MEDNYCCHDAETFSNIIQAYKNTVTYIKILLQIYSHEQIPVLLCIK